MEKIVNFDEHGGVAITGELVRCGECKWYDPLDRTRPFFCPVMDCETGVMEDDFCSRGERRAKMEVQDAAKDDDAADAIEALQAKLADAEERVKELTNECKRLMDDRPVLDSVQGKYVWVCPNCGTEIRLYGEMEGQDGQWLLHTDW